MYKPNYNVAATTAVETELRKVFVAWCGQYGADSKGHRDGESLCALRCWHMQHDIAHPSGVELQVPVASVMHSVLHYVFVVCRTLHLYRC